MAAQYVNGSQREGLPRELTTTSIIMLPLAPAKPLPPKEYTSWEMIALMMRHGSIERSKGTLYYSRDEEHRYADPTETSKYAGCRKRDHTV